MADTQWLTNPFDYMHQSACCDNEPCVCPCDACQEEGHDE
jgi:hypothetical protein